MRTFLLFTLEAPLAGLGDVAVGERRYGAERPARSAMLGLVAAALGIERRDEAAHAALGEGYGCAVRVDRPGRLLEDYHTTQVPPARRGRRFTSRRAELRANDLETILSLRDYRTDARYTVALWERDAPPHSLAELGNALRRPTFNLYFGRKACPLGRPPAPQLIEAASLADAFDRFEDPLVPCGPSTVHADLDARDFLGEGLREDREVRRRDALVSRSRWQFGLRDELVAEPVPRGSPS